MTAGQAEFLANLSPEERARFDAWPASKRTTELSYHAAKFKPLIARDQCKELGRKTPALAAESVPTIPELLRQIAAGALEGAGMAAEWMCRDFGSPSDRKLWGQFSHVCMSIGRGTIDVDEAIEAYNQAMESPAERTKRGLQPIRNRGAKFWSVLQCRTGIGAENLPHLAAGR